MLVCPDSVLSIVNYPHGLYGTLLQGFGSENAFGHIRGKVYIHLGGSYHLACCGASSITNLSCTFDTEKEVQNFVCKLKRNITSSQTYYAIAATYQTEGEGGKFGNTCQILMALGAEEVDARPNRNHGPNDMHLLVWNPDKADWSKYLSADGSPLWWNKLSPKDQQKEIDNSIAAFAEYEKQCKAREEANKRATMATRIWQGFYDARDGRLNERLVQHGFKPVEKENVAKSPLESRVQSVNAIRPPQGEKW